MEHDLHISGIGNSTGDKFRNIRITGANSIDGDTECASFACSGAGNVNGSLKCTEFSCSGAGKVTKDLVCTGLMKVSGAVSVEGETVAETLKISGSYKTKQIKAVEVTASGMIGVSGDISAEKSVRSSGILNCGRDLIAEEIYIKGGIDVKGLINAEKTEIILHKNVKCHAGALGGAEITVRRYSDEESSSGVLGVINSIVNAFVPNGSEARFTVDAIEGDKISLEYTDAEIVRGHDITVGDGCDIKRVEYTGKVTYSESAKIGEMVEI